MIGINLTGSGLRDARKTVNDCLIFRHSLNLMAVVFTYAIGSISRVQNFRGSHLAFVAFGFLRALRGRPTFRSFTASRSFGSISHSRPNLSAFKRFALIIARTLFAVTSNRFAASVVVMIFMAQSIAFCEIMA